MIKLKNENPPKRANFFMNMHWISIFLIKIPLRFVTYTLEEEVLEISLDER